MEQAPNLTPIERDLQLLENEWIVLNDELVRPSRCYYLQTNPPYLLFNLNCPDTLKTRLHSIMKKHVPDYQNGLNQTRL